MVKQREGHTVIFSELALVRISNSECPSCGKNKSEWTRRKDWRCCSYECTEKFWQEQVVVKSWQDLRLKVFRLDNFTCRHCRQQPKVVYKHYVYAVDKERCFRKTREESVFSGHEKWEALASSELVADHIHPIALGGAEWDIHNIQTLCKKCNKKKTAQDSKKIAVLRKVEKLEVKGQRFL